MEALDVGFKRCEVRWGQEFVGDRKDRSDKLIDFGGFEWAHLPILAR
jgi:hypothetical protein